MVVLPFVPVTPTSGLGKRREASSTSLQTGILRLRAACTSGEELGTPGLFTSSPAPSSSRTLSSPSLNSMPALASSLTSSSVERSTATTVAPRRARARAAARPDRARPSTSTRSGSSLTWAAGGGS